MDEIIDVETLFIDELTGQMFCASQKDIESAKNQLNELIALNDHVTMEDYVKVLGLYNKNDAVLNDMLQHFAVEAGPIEFITDETESGIKINISKNWVMIDAPWDS